MDEQQHADQAPRPEAGWSRSIISVQRARVFPPQSARGHWVPAGILYPRGRYCPEGATWRYERRMSVRPAPLEPTGGLIEGRWLWGGFLMNHFGHFLIESTTRLWALDHTKGPIDGILYIPKRPRASPQLTGWQQRIISLLGIDLPVRVVAEPSVVRELVVPGQGCGIGPITPGTPEMRAFVRDRMAPDIAPEGPERLYVSRSGLGDYGSMIIGEQALEAEMAAEGYEIFHPEAHPLDTQIARYRAARHIVLSEGSAAHLIALCARPPTRVAMVARRSYWTEYPADHIRHFSGCEVVVAEAIQREWRPVDAMAHRNVSFGELDLFRLQRELRAAGFVSAASPWNALPDSLAQEVFARMGLVGAFQAG